MLVKKLTSIMFNLSKGFTRTVSLNVQNIGTAIMFAALYLCLCIGRIVLDTVTSFMGCVYYGKQIKRIPSIREDILKLSAVQLAAKIRSKQLKSEDVVNIYISRIKFVNPAINAVNENHFREAIQLARAADDYIHTSGRTAEHIAKTKPLLGVPVSIKNSFSVKGWAWDTGSHPRRTKKGEQDAPAVLRLRQAGAIPLVLTNVPELCMWLDSYNTIYGSTCNPYDLSRIPGGSSGGEAALIAAAGSVLGLGNDIGGSLRFPAFFCGIYSHKPSTGLVSTDLIYPTPGKDTISYATVGPLCRYVSDLRLSLKVLTGRNASKLQLDKEVDFSQVKFFYLTEIDDPLTTSVQPEIKKATEKAVFHFKNKYCSSVERLSIPLINNIFVMWMTAMKVGDNPSFAELMTDMNGNVKLLPEFLLWCLRRPRHTLPILLLALMEKFSPPKDSEGYKKVMSKLDRLKNEFHKIFNVEDKEIVLIMPPYPETAPFHNETLLKSVNCGYSFIFNLTGMPVTTCPTGRGKNNLPIGVQIASGLNKDYLTIKVAEELDLVFGGWTAP